ncbi:MAG: SDR family oxidoreductase [Caulobacteraceae bacterium]
MADKVALVVGASRGLGLGYARELAARGWKVIATARNPATANDLTALANGSGGAIEVEALDSTDRTGLDRLVARLSTRTLDLLMVVAGVAGPTGDELGAPEGDIANVFLTNAVAPVRIAEALKGNVRDGSGVIAMITSGLGSVAAAPPMPGVMLYKASKAALNSMTRSFTLALGDRKLTVLSVSPGWVRTDMGGPAAPLSVEQSATGVINLVEAKAGTGAHGFYGLQGETIPW